MKKLIKIVAVAVLIASSVEANGLEDYDRHIANAKNPADKQTLICEREAEFILKDPMKCIKATQISSKEYEAISFGGAGYGDYKNYVAGMYYNAGIIYGKIGDNANKIIMFKKALEISPNNSGANLSLGFAYYHGKGIEINKIKAYEHWRVAAKQGDQDAQNAQNNLDILCNESPWACK